METTGNPSDREANPAVTIILVNWNSRDDTIECLESVFRLSYPNFRVIVCDNNSNDGSLENIQEWAEGHVPVSPASPAFAGAFAKPRVKKKVGWVRYKRVEAEAGGRPEELSELVLIETGANLGFAGGNNIGIRYALKRARPDFLWLLNTDTLVHPDALSALINRSRHNKDIGMIGSSLIYYWEPDRVQIMGGATMDIRSTRMRHIGDAASVNEIPDNPEEIEKKMAYVCGASMLVSRDFIERAGLMCEDYFLYYEEIDWFLRAKGHFKLGYAPKSLVFHKVGGASRRVAHVRSMGYLYRNRIKFAARFMPGSITGTMLSMAFDMVRAGLKRRFRLSLVIAKTLLESRRLIVEGKRKPERMRV